MTKDKYSHSELVSESQSSKSKNNCHSELVSESQSSKSKNNCHSELVSESPKIEHKNKFLHYNLIYGKNYDYRK